MAIIIFVFHPESIPYKGGRNGCFGISRRNQAADRPHCRETRPYEQLLDGTSLAKPFQISKVIYVTDNILTNTLAYTTLTIDLIYMPFYKTATSSVELLNQW